MRPSIKSNHHLAALALIGVLSASACGDDNNNAAANNTTSNNTTSNNTASNNTASNNTMSNNTTSNNTTSNNTASNNTTSNNTTTNNTIQEFAACEGEFTLEEPDPNRPWTPNAITLVSEELSPGVFVVYDSNAEMYGPTGFPLATSGGFVVGDDGVLLVETMINRQLFCQFIDLVREQTDLPVLYAVNTSYHGDHSYGNMFLPDEVQVVQHQGTVDFITNPDSFAGDVAFMEANFGADQGLDEIVAVEADIVVDDSGWSVDLGNRTVEARYLGFGQTEGDLFVYVPDADVVWVGNPVVAREPAIPWLLDGHAAEVHDTLTAVKDAFPTARIVPGHDSHQPVEGVQFSVDYLDTLLVEVQSAVDAGMTAEETAGAVTMEDFQGYALWDWVHSGLNVPMTYGELSQ
ncbi:MAG: MBL fold metallo-hydrolase [Halobacteriales archaeon]|nr:MBL fold metallo-hydrolase [Halobacteriales archaeon]